MTKKDTHPGVLPPYAEPQHTELSLGKKTKKTRDSCNWGGARTRKWGRVMLYPSHQTLHLGRTKADVPTQEGEGPPEDRDPSAHLGLFSPSPWFGNGTHIPGSESWKGKDLVLFSAVLTTPR